MASVISVNATSECDENTDRKRGEQTLALG